MRGPDFVPHYEEDSMRGVVLNRESHRMIIIKDIPSEKSSQRAGNGDLSLPISKNRKPVCRQMFLSTLRVTERQSRTRFRKKKKARQMEIEKTMG